MSEEVSVALRYFICLILYVVHEDGALDTLTLLHMFTLNRNTQLGQGERKSRRHGKTDMMALWCCWHCSDAG